VDDIRPPVLWRRPKTKIYDYNQRFGNSYYAPMIDYVDCKQRQGIFFERPTERIHLPDPAELVMEKPEFGLDESAGYGSLDRFLVQAYSQQAKESNSATAKTKLKMLNTVTARKALPHTVLDNQQTFFSSLRLLKGEVPGRKQRNFYTTELGVLKNSKDFARRVQSDHLDEVMCGIYNPGAHGMGGPLADEPFYDPERVKNYTGAIRFKDPERVIADIL